MSDLLKKIAYWALVLTLVVAEIGSFFDLFNINPWCYPVYAALLIQSDKWESNFKNYCNMFHCCSSSSYYNKRTGCIKGWRKFMDWNIGWVFWIGCSYFLTIVNCYFVLVKKAKYNYIIGVSGIAFFSVALLEELRMFSQWIEDGEVGMLTHALQNLPVQFTIRFLIVVGITALLIIIDLHRTK